MVKMVIRRHLLRLIFQSFRTDASVSRVSKVFKSTLLPRAISIFGEMKLKIVRKSKDGHCVHNYEVVLDEIIIVVEFI